MIVKVFARHAGSDGVPAMGAANLPLGMMCTFLVAFYIALSALGLRYFRYLRQKYSTQPPADPRWTLAVFAEHDGHKLTHKLDIDNRVLDVGTKQVLPSMRSTIEMLVNSGVRLTYRDALRKIPASEGIVRDYELSRSGSRIELQPSTGDSWSLASLKLSKHGDNTDLEIDLEPVRAQIKGVLEQLLSESYFLSEARQQVKLLSIGVVKLEPGEVVESEVLLMSSSKVCRAICCNQVASRNERKMFTSKEYTKGAVIQSFGEPLPKEVMYSSTLAGSVVLCLTWAAFYPGLMFDRTAADCTMSTSSGFCTADRVMENVNFIQSKVREVVRFEEARFQAERTAAQADVMAFHASNYTCTEELVNETALELSDIAGFTDIEAIRREGFTYNVTGHVPFPDWCGNLRQEWIRRQRRKSCPDRRCETVQIEDHCKYFDGLGFLGATRYCLSEVADNPPESTWPITEEVCINYEATCDGSFHRELDQKQAALTDYLEDKARRYSGAQSQAVAFQEELKDSVTEMATRFAEDLKYRVDLASDLFIYYCILGLWFPTPFIVNRSPWKTGVIRNVFGVSKRTFVLYVIVVTIFVDLVRELQDGVNLTLYFYNIASNPCFLDGDFLAARAAVIGNVCGQLRNYSQQVAEANSTVASLYIDIDVYGLAPLPEGCGCDYPGDRAAVDAFVLNNQTGLQAFVGDLAFCSNATAQRDVLNPPQADVNWWTVWFKSGVIAELILKVTLVNLAHAIVGYTDPLAIVGGTYEVHRGSRPLSVPLQEEIAMLMAYQHARDICIWGFIAFVAIANLLLSGVASVSTSDADVQGVMGPDGTGVATMRSSVGGCVDGQDTSHALSATAWFGCLTCLVGIAAFGGRKLLDRQQAKTERDQLEQNKATKAQEVVKPIDKFKAVVRVQKAATAFVVSQDTRHLTPTRTGRQRDEQLQGATTDRIPPPTLPLSRSLSSLDQNGTGLSVPASASDRQSAPAYLEGADQNPEAPKSESVGASSIIPREPPPDLSGLAAAHLDTPTLPPHSASHAGGTALRTVQAVAGAHSRSQVRSPTRSSAGPMPGAGGELLPGAGANSHDRARPRSAPRAGGTALRTVQAVAGARRRAQGRPTRGARQEPLQGTGGSSQQLPPRAPRASDLSRPLPRRTLPRTPPRTQPPSLASLSQP